VTDTVLSHMISNGCIFFNLFRKLSAFEKLEDYGSFGSWVQLSTEQNET